MVRVTDTSKINQHSKLQEKEGLMVEIIEDGNPEKTGNLKGVPNGGQKQTEEQK